MALASRLMTFSMAAGIALAPVAVLAKTEAHDAHAEVATEGHGDAHADDAHGGHGPLTLHGVLTNPEFWGTLVNFTALLIILGFAVKKVVNPSMAKRRSAIQKDLEEAKLLKQAAAEKAAEYQARLDKLDAEVDDIRAEMIAAGEAERDRIVQEAEEKASRLRKDARFMIDQQMKQLRQDLTREAAQAAVQAAESLLVREISATDQDRLADAYLNRMEEVVQDRESQS